MSNELLRIGPFTVYGYGLMIAIGIISAYVLAEYRAKRRGMPYEQIITLLIWCVIGGFLSAKILYWMTQWRDIVNNPAAILDMLGDGFIVYGGIIGGIASGYLFCRKKKLRFLQFFDLIMPSVALAQGFGRIGCFLAGCCYGKETDYFLAVTFHNSDFAPNGIPLIPVQLFSSALNFLHAGILIWLSGQLKKEGQIGAVYLILYSMGRFLIEFLRGDLERGEIGIFSTSQFISLFIWTAGIFFLFFIKIRNIQKKTA